MVKVKEAAHLTFSNLIYRQLWVGPSKKYMTSTPIQMKTMKMMSSKILWSEMMLNMEMISMIEGQLEERNMPWMKHFLILQAEAP